jgi:hypothetical protein
MTDSKTSHWESLAADLGGSKREPEITPEKAIESKESVADRSASEKSVGTDEPIPPAEKTSVSENPTATGGPPPKKKKRGSWAFWRSGNKDKNDVGESGAEGNSALSDDPLALLNQAETTDDMACAIDQLFSRSESDTRDDEVVFDAEEIATSIDFDDENTPASRDGDAERSQDGRRSRNRGGSSSRRTRDGDSRGENRDRENSGRRRGDRENRRPRENQRSSNRDEPRSRRSENRDRDRNAEGSERRQGRRRKETPSRPDIDHGDVPTWDTAVSFVVDNNMATRDGKSGGNKKAKSRSKKKSRR